MTHTREDADLTQRLLALAGVERVLIHAPGAEAWLILRRDADAERVTREAREITGPVGIDVVPLFPSGLRDRHRVRFVAVDRSIGADQQVTFTTRLEWSGSEYVGSAAGEHSLPIEIRTAAAATLDAVHQLLPPDVPIRLAGVKQMRAFDADLVVVSLYRPDSTPQYLVGTVVAGDDPRRAAALAVLNALNRVLGNYLTLG